MNETARSFELLGQRVKEIENIEFIWFTDGCGWNNAKSMLKGTFDSLEHIYNINDFKTY